MVETTVLGPYDMYGAREDDSSAPYLGVDLNKVEHYIVSRKDFTAAREQQPETRHPEAPLPTPERVFRFRRLLTLKKGVIVEEERDRDIVLQVMLAFQRKYREWGRLKP